MNDDDKDDGYYEHVRHDLLDLFPTPPRRLLDVGCGAGAMLAAAKSRWPQTATVGIEIVPEAAERARERADHVIAGSVEHIDMRAAELRDVDAVLLADVLEHLVDPWAFLTRLRASLAPDAVVVASIPNVANLWLIEQLLSGRFDYAAEGLLDVTHLRFFTRRTIGEMFAKTGYRIERVERVTDGRVDDLTRRRILGIMLPPLVAGRLFARRITISGVSETDYQDLRTVQFFIVARPDGSATS